jgi:hypothetical protein
MAASKKRSRARKPASTNGSDPKSQTRPYLILELLERVSVPEGGGESAVERENEHRIVGREIAKTPEGALRIWGEKLIADEGISPSGHFAVVAERHWTVLPAGVKTTRKLVIG